MSNDIADQLRDSLHRHADALPYGPDLTGAAIARASSIRRRRRSVAAVAAAALLAIAVPVGLQAGDGATRGRAPVEPVGSPGVTVDVADLPDGGEPEVPYRQLDAYLLDGGSYDLGGLDVGSLTAWDGGAVLTVTDPETGDAVLYVADGTGRPRLLADGGIVSTGTSPDGRWLAYVVGQADPTVVIEDAGSEDDPAGGASSSASASAVPLPSPARVVQVSDDGQVLLQHERDRALLADESGVQPLGLRGVSAWSPTEGLYANVTRVSGLRACSAVTTDDGGTLWRTCDWIIDAFSPDGRWAYALPSVQSGYASTSAAVLDARSGAVVRVIRSSDATTGVGVMDATWEADDALLLRIEQGTQAALVRVDVLSGRAEVAAGPRRVEPYASETPFLLG